jgi:predicted RNA methylase
MAGWRKVEISEPVRGVLANGVACDGNRLKITRQLDRSLYEATNKVLAALGGKWDRRSGAHLFAEDAGDLIESALDRGCAIDVKKSLEQFDTPHALARQMARKAEISELDHVLEPSAGAGNLLLAVGPEHPWITAIEVDPKRCAQLRKLAPRATVTEADFLLMGALPCWDVALMNPPFSNGQDIRHVRHAWEFLRAGGRLVAITSPHWTFAQDRASAAFGAWIEEIRADVSEIPAGTFQEAGTNIRSQLIYARK